MGAGASKPARAAGAAARRQYPKQPSPTTRTAPPTTKGAPRAPKQQDQSAGPQYHTKEKASTTRSEAIDLDARDPHFAASLRSIGPVIPNPTLSHSSTFNATQPASGTSSPYPSPTSNPALLTLSSRAALARAAEQEIDTLGRTSHAGREFLDIVTIKQILVMRDRQGVRPEVIERHLRLKEGVVGRLGARGVVGEVR